MKAEATTTSLSTKLIFSRFTRLNGASLRGYGLHGMKVSFPMQQVMHPLEPAPPADPDAAEPASDACISADRVTGKLSRQAQAFRSSLIQEKTNFQKITGSLRRSKNERDQTALLGSDTGALDMQLRSLVPWYSN